VLNALNGQTIAELREAMLACQRDDTVRRRSCSPGAGEKSFVAGADINELAVLTPTRARNTRRRPAGVRSHRAARQARDRGRQRLCARRRLRAGDGVHAALAADTARFGQPEINLGIIPGYAGSQRLPRLVGKGRALEILLTGDMVPAQRAYEIGLVNRWCPRPT
jgi:enoyl-CoA hydratase